MPRESSITALAIKKLNAIEGCHVEKRHSGMFGNSEVDLCGCYNGRAFFLEGKQPGRDASPRQKSILRKWRRVGAIVGVYHTAAEAVEIVLTDKKWEE